MPYTSIQHLVQQEGRAIAISTREPAYVENKSEDHKAECFQCTLDPLYNPCAVAELEGHLLGAYERVINGAKIPIIGLTTTSGRVDIYLPDYYQKFVRELQQRDQVIRGLPIKLYHLPHSPIATEYKGRPKLIFQANSYTLAVLEPDILLNITDLSQADYCARQYLLNTLVTSPPNAATLRGNLIHYCFKELLKAHDHDNRESNSDAAHEDEAPLTILQRHLETALQQNAIDLALASVSLTEMRQQATPHLESLAVWYQEQRSTLWDLFTSIKPTHSRQVETTQGSSEVSAETFLLAPEIGLKGRLDLYWQQSTRQRLLELKTGGASGDVPKSGHRRQVNGYSSLLTVRRNEKKKAEAILLYSGTPGQAESRGIPFTIRDMQKVIETRNLLVLDHITGIPAAPPGPSRCTKCSLLNTCTTVSSLLQWQAPEPVKAEPDETPPSPTQQGEAELDASVITNLLPVVYSNADHAFFAKFYDLLRIEGLEGERQQALLWKTPVEERIERGTTINLQERIGDPAPTVQGEWHLTFRCENTSELREGDEIFLSDGNPIEGAVVTGTIVSISTHEVTLWTPELIANPTLVDRNESNLVHTRTLKNLLRWLEVDAHLRELVAGTIRPRFALKESDFIGDSNSKLNTAQKLAVEKALRMQDYLLIQGPPGTGKTSVIAEIVKQLSQRGERILLAAFTNQAVDNMLRRLDSEGFSDYVRLGHDRSVHADVQKRLLKNLLASQESEVPLPEQTSQAQTPVNTLLYRGQVVASTTATWSSEKYAAPTLSKRTDTAAQLPLQFDVAIIDEASQLTIPAILGALRLAKRFILVGDDKQLPPLVLSKEAAQKGLANSLFSFLKQLDNDYMKEGAEVTCACESACVALQVQYRMNQWISNYSSVVFYEKKLLADKSVKDRILLAPSMEKWLANETEAITKVIEPKHPLVFLDVQPDTELPSAIAKSNDLEAQAIRDVVQGLLARGIEERDIGIIAPFRAQVANIRRALFEKHSESGWPGMAPATPMSIDTVDRFQGGERGVIILSFTVAQPLANDSPLREFLINPNRLNVALTRAQRKLILVGNISTLEGLPYFDRLLTYCRSMKTIIPYAKDIKQP